MKSHNWGLCRKCGEVHTRENARKRNSYKQAVFHENSYGRKFSSCADCGRRLKDGEKIFKRTINYRFPRKSMSCLIAYYCEECSESHVAGSPIPLPSRNSREPQLLIIRDHVTAKGE